MQHIKTLISGLSIGSRMIILQAVAIFALIASIGVSYYQINAYNSVAERASDLRIKAQAVLTAKTVLLDLNRLIEQYLVTKNPELLQKINQDGEALLNTVPPRLSDDASSIVNNGKSIIALQQLLGTPENEGLEGLLKKEVKSVEEAIEDAEYEELFTGDLDPVRVKMLMLRRHEKNFILRGDEREIALFQNRISEFEFKLADSKLEQETQKTILDRLQKYVSAFLEWSEKNAESRETIERFRAETLAFLEELKSVTAQNQASFAAAESKRKSAQAAFLPTILTLGLILISISAVLFFAITHSIRSPLAKLTKAMHKLSNGAIDVEIPRFETKDEIGLLSKAAGAFQKLSEADKEMARKQASDAQESAERAQELDTLIETLNTTISFTIKTVNENTASATDKVARLAAVANETRDRSSTATDYSSQASSQLTLISSATTELSQSARLIADQVKSTNTVAAKASDSVRDASGRISTLLSSMEEISEIVALIEDIADRTNLLALNATIEAARAGDAGKGFSVVAQEVKELANQTAKATAGITAKVTAIQGETEGAANSVRSIEDIVANVEEATAAIAGTIAQQDSATADIAKNVEDVNTRVSAVKADMGEMLLSVEDGSRSADDLKASCQTIESQVDELSTTIRKFLDRVKAA